MLFYTNVIYWVLTENTLTVRYALLEILNTSVPGVAIPASMQRLVCIRLILNVHGLGSMW